MSSEVFKINVKLYVEEGAGLSHEQFVPVLHTWIQNHAVPDHMLIDVADYSHVHNGPGTLLVSHEANFYLDRLDGVLGLTYSRKQPAEGSFQDRLRQATKAALEAAARLEESPALAGRIKFRTNELQIRLSDRLLAPNTPETYKQVRPEIDALAAVLYPGAAVEVEYNSSTLSLFELRLTAPDTPGIAPLLNRLAVAAPAPAR